MIFRGNKLFNASFDAYADNYQSVRPGYPDELMADIVKACNISEQSTLLEIGAGSGIATIKLAANGSRIIALEPGENLAKIAEAQLKDFPNVEVVVDTFEHFSSAVKFDSILSFTSFHWLSGTDTIHRVGQLLNPDGTLVVVWNSFLQQQSTVTDEIEKIYQADLRDIYPGDNNTAIVNKIALDKVDGRINAIMTDSALETVFLNRYLVTYTYDEVTYPKFLATYPKIINLDDDRRQPFLRRIAEAINVHGPVTVPVLSTVIVCRKRDDFMQQVANS